MTGPPEIPPLPGHDVRLRNPAPLPNPADADTVVIANLSPLVDDGAYPIKRLAGDDLRVQADLFRDGHDILTARLKWRLRDADTWQETAMDPLGNDRWSAACTFPEPGYYEYTIQAWSEPFLSWRHDFSRKVEAGQVDLETEILEAAILVESAASRALEAGQKDHGEALQAHARLLRDTASAAKAAELVAAADLNALMQFWSDRSLSTSLDPPLTVLVERERAGFSAWYEFFPRSAAGSSDTHSTFRDCLPRIDDARAMGFDVIYFPPIHPIGLTNRKGKNNSLTCLPGEPGSPWAIGSHQGGHKAIAPALGNLEDFRWLVAQTRARGMEIALDFAINCSPDHPYVQEHPEWFFHRPDGTIKYAENPPKKYQDIYPLNFHCEDWRNLWREMVEVVLFWVDQGVRIFRVDNPHTKPVAFWKYLIEEVRREAFDTIFLAEAFTRPRMMETLGKIGFSQSYTYFTWRHSKQDFTEYLTELTRGEMADYFRANFWPNTPDILSHPLRHGGHAAFKMRAVLAATLCPNWGIYSGYEFCENTPMSDENEEYFESEKYQLVDRDWNNPDNIKEFIGRLNAIRRGNPALQRATNIEFCHTGNDQVLAWVKTTPDRSNCILVTVNLDPGHRQESNLHIPLETFGLHEDAAYQVHDLLAGESFLWQGRFNFVALDPSEKVAHVFRLEK